MYNDVRVERNAQLHSFSQYNHTFISSQEQS